MPINHAASVIRQQRKAQAREDAAAIEQKRVRAFLRMALPENAVLRDPPKLAKTHKPWAEKPKKQAAEMISFGVTIGENYKPSAVCKCLPWNYCSCNATVNEKNLTIFERVSNGWLANELNDRKAETGGYFFDIGN